MFALKSTMYDGIVKRVFTRGFSMLNGASNLNTGVVSGARTSPFGMAPSTLKRKRRFGFLSRLKTKDGRKIIERRKAKGRWYLSH